MGKIWSLSTGQCLQTLQGHPDCVYSVIYLQDKDQLVSGSDDKTLKIWDVKGIGQKREQRLLEQQKREQLLLERQQKEQEQQKRIERERLLLKQEEQERQQQREEEQRQKEQEQRQRLLLKQEEER